MRDFFLLTFQPGLFFSKRKVFSPLSVLLFLLSFLLPAFSHAAVFFCFWKQWLDHIRDAFQVLSDVLILSALPAYVEKLFSNPEMLTYLELKYVLGFFIMTVLLFSLLRFIAFFLLLVAPMASIMAKPPVLAEAQSPVPEPRDSSSTLRKTFRAFAFSQILWIWAVIPFLGIPVAWFLSLSVLAHGLKKTVGLSTGQSLLAVGIAAFSEVLVWALLASCTTTFLIDVMYHYWPKV